MEFVCADDRFGRFLLFSLRRFMLYHWIICFFSSIDLLEIEAASGKPRRKSSLSSSISISTVPFKYLQTPRVVALMRILMLMTQLNHTEKQHEARSYRFSFEFWVAKRNKAYLIWIYQWKISAYILSSIRN